VELGFSTLTRRERLERIAMAERDRRAGRVAVAVAALGEASEWPARVVLALARLPEFEAVETRQILEQGLDLWVAEVGLDPFEERAGTPSSELDRPIDNAELERVFAEAEAQTDEMHSANHVAARVLMDEPIGLAEMGGDMLTPVEESDAISMDIAFVEGAEDQAAADSCLSQPQVLATLEQWLQNLEGSSARRAR
jgi:hypothetical protein